MHRTFHALLAVLALAASACDSSDPNREFTVEATPATAELFSAAPGNTVDLAVVVRDDAGEMLQGGTRSFSTANSAVATVSDAGVITAVGVGTTQITASVELDGGTASATTTVTVANAAAAATVRAPGFTYTPGTVDIQAGGTVTWTMEGVHHTVDFQTPGAPGNIGELTNASASRTFPASGTYRYDCAFHAQMTGVVRVH